MGRGIGTALTLGALLSMASPLAAGEADVVAAEAERKTDGSYTFVVTLRHADEGWDHYADRWDVLAPDGTILAERVLYHPHVDEQPFTRSLSGVALPDGVETVTIRAHDSVHGLGGVEVTLRVSGR